MTKNARITVASFSVNKIIPYLQTRPGSLTFNKPVVRYEGKDYPSGFMMEANKGMYNRGIMAVGVVDHNGEVKIVSPLFRRRLNLVKDGLTDDEAYAFGYQLGKTFPSGQTGYELVEDLRLLEGLENLALPNEWYIKAVDDVRRDPPLISIQKLGKDVRVMPFLIYNPGKINEGILNGQLRSGRNGRNFVS